VFSDEGELTTSLVFRQTLSARAQEALRKAKDELEMRVAERTAQLISVNRQLQLEPQGARGSAGITGSFAGILDIADDAIISVDATQRITFSTRERKRFLAIPLLRF